jgi:hypothetical protein
MSNETATKDDVLPGANMWRGELLPRWESRVRENLRGKVREVGLSALDVATTSVQSVNTKLQRQVWRPDGAELLKRETIFAAEGQIDIFASRATTQARDHLGQLRNELERVPEPTNGFSAQAIWLKLDGLDPHDRNRLIANTDDPQVVSAVLHAPSVFALGSDDARRRMLASYNRAHRPQQVALANDLEAFISVVDEVTAGVKRLVRDALR